MKIIEVQLPPRFRHAKTKRLQKKWTKKYGKIVVHHQIWSQRYRRFVMHYNQAM